MDNSNGSTVYVFPLTSQLQWNVQVGVTQMPIPLQPVPLLLNFGGAMPSIQITWVVTDTNNSSGSLGGTLSAAADWNQMMNNIKWGSSTAGYTLYLPEVSTVGSTLTVQGYIFQVQFTYSGGQINRYDASLTFYPGTVV